MAKKSMVARDVKRSKKVKKYAAKRKALKSVIYSESATPAEKKDAVLKIQKLPRDSSPTRQRERCSITGRPNGTFRKFGLCRNKLRELANQGEVPGVIRASW